MIFASGAPGQNDFLSAFIADSSVDFTRIDAFHIDEYIGLDGNASAGIRKIPARQTFL